MRRAPFVVLSLLFLACGSSDSGEPATPGGSAGSSAGGSGGSAGATQMPSEIAGTKLMFDLAADLHSPDHAFDAPYPSDLRLDANGAPDVVGFPEPIPVHLFENLRAAVAQHRAFPQVPVAYFRFDGALAARSVDDLIPADASSPILLVDVDPSSPERGRLFPTVATVLENDGYAPDDVLAVAARPGFILRPSRKYAFVVLRSLGDANGAPLGVPLTMAQLLAGVAVPGDAGGKAQMLYAPLLDTLKTAKIDPSTVAAATVFTTGDVVADLADLSDRIKASRTLTIDNLHVDPDDGATHPRFCEIVGEIRYPQFQKGTPPFDTDGLFEIGGDGLPVQQREEVAPVRITLPKAPMPAGGYPLTLYFHGSGGLSTAPVDRGTWHVESDPTKCPEGTLEDWMGTKGCNTKGEGPAHVLAPFGIAMAASALPLNPERFPAGASNETSYLNFDNLAAFRDTFRQGVIEQRLFLEALRKLVIPPEVVASCSGLSLPDGAPGYRFADDPVLAQGQSMGGMYANLVSATEPRIKAVVPTGAGGYWSYFILKTSLIDNIEGKLKLVLATKAPLSFVHPALHMFETADEAAEPFVYMARVHADPLPGHPMRPVYEPVGLGDSYFPSVVYDAAAIAYDHQEAGDVIWPTMQPALALRKNDGILPYPVSNNRPWDVPPSGDGASPSPVTGVVVQYMGDGVYDPHALYSQLDAVKYQYSCFFSTFLQTGTAKVGVPMALGSACP